VSYRTDQLIQAMLATYTIPVGKIAKKAV